jgi:NitT/TauT family transport system substrate-binding protein
MAALESAAGPAAPNPRRPCRSHSATRVLVGAALLLLAAACSAPAAAPTAPAGGAAPSAGSAAPAAPPPMERIRVGYATPSGGFAAPWMAKDAGLFEKYGLDAELTYIASGPTLLQSMVAGEVQFGELAAPASMNAYIEGGEVVWITGTVNRPILFVIAPPEIRRLEDLRGRPVGVTRIGTTTHIFMKLALRSAGMDAERDVQILQTGGVPETVAALQSGGIFAGVGGPPGHLRALAAGMHIVADLAELGIPWPFGGAVTTRSHVAAQPDRVRRFVRAYTEAVHLLRTDRERSVNVIAKYTELSDRAIAEQTWEIYRDRYALPPLPDLAAMETVVQEELGLTNPRARDVPPREFYDDRFVRELVDSGFVRELESRQ